MLKDPSQTRYAHWLLILALFMPVLAATLPVMQFTDSMESFNVLTAVETARDGHWAVPTLWGRPRLEKPPLVQWLTATGIKLGGPIEFSSRLATLTLSCLTLVVVYEWARLFSSARTALMAAVMTGTTLAFLRFSRRAGYDSQLMFWVALTSYALTYFVVRGRMLLPIIFGGLALGGALMSKGPPALLHTVVPVGIYCGVMAAVSRDWGKMRRAVIVLAGVIAIGVAVMVPWVVAAAEQKGGMVQAIATWRDQLAREGERREGLSTSPLEGLVYLPMLAPWTFWYLLTFALAWRERRGNPHLAYLLTLSVVPVVIHAFIPPIRDRYLLPMIPPAAIACTLLFTGWLERARSRSLTQTDRLAYVVHIAILASFVIGYPLYFAFTSEDRMPPIAAGALAGLGALVLCVTVALRYRWPAVLAVATFIAMVQSQVVYAWHQNREHHELELVGRLVSREAAIKAVYGYENDLPPRSFAIYCRKPFVLVPSSAVPPGSLLVSEFEPPAGSTRLNEFRDGRRHWVLWQTPGSISTMPDSHGQ